MKRSTFTFRMSDEDYKRFSEAAEKAGMTLGEWIRTCAFNSLPKNVQAKLTPMRKRGRPPKKGKEV